MNDITPSEEDNQVLNEFYAFLASIGITGESLKQLMWKIDHPEEYRALQLKRWDEHVKYILSTNPDQ